MLESNVHIEEGDHPSTKDRILDAAEQLFSELGFEATSLRMITGAAGVNLASVNYHFHSKEDLIRAVFARRLGTVNKMRLERLQNYLDTVGKGSVELEPVIRAFIEPVLVLRSRPKGAAVARLFGRTYAEPSGEIKRAFFELMREIARPFTDAFRRALPDISQVELIWKMHFAVGVMAHTLAGAEHLKWISGGLCDFADPNAVAERMVAFIAAGLRAPMAAVPNRS